MIFDKKVRFLQTKKNFLTKKVKFLTNILINISIPHMKFIIVQKKFRKSEFLTEKFSVQFPFSKITKRSENLIKSLCASDPSNRLGYQKEGLNGIRKHRWFEGFDWENLQSEKIQAPIIPPIKNPFDGSNFAKVQEEDIRKIPDENSGWDDDF